MKTAAPIAVRRREVILAVLRGLLLAALLGNFLFAHGCHGDEDHELFQSLQTIHTTKE
jgi:hypothetical protein